MLNVCKFCERSDFNHSGVKLDIPEQEDRGKDDLVEVGFPQGVDFAPAPLDLP